jgi:hypothetical protein
MRCGPRNRRHLKRLRTRVMTKTMTTMMTEEQ